MKTARFRPECLSLRCFELETNLPQLLGTAVASLEMWCRCRLVPGPERKLHKTGVRESNFNINLLEYHGLAESDNGAGLFDLRSEREWETLHEMRQLSCFGLELA